jgi:hypothetical protein
LSNLAVEKKPIFFWERIAFRITVGFLLPLIVSVYALFSISSTLLEMGELKEHVHGTWISVRAAETSSVLQVAKIRLRIQALITERDPKVAKELERSLLEIRTNLDNSKKAVVSLVKDFNVPNDVAYDKQLASADQLRVDMLEAVKMVTTEMRHNNVNNALGERREFEKKAVEVEVLLGRIRAMNEILESKVMDVIAAREAQSRTQVTWTLAIIILIGIGASLVVTYSILAPINQIVRRFKNIATGDGDLSKRIHTRSGGELTELAHWMNVFLDRTESIIGTIGNAAEIIKTVTEEVSNQTNRTSVAASGINRMMLEQATGIEAGVRSA